MKGLGGESGQVKVAFSFFKQEEGTLGKGANVTFRFLVWATEPTVTTFATILRDGPHWSKALRGERLHLQEVGLRESVGNSGW